MRFNELKIQPGDTVQVSVTGIDGQNHSYDAQFVGVMNAVSVILEKPLDGGMVEWSAGMKVAVNCFLPTGIATFGTLLDVYYEAPFPHLHVSFPQQINFREVRGSARVEAKLPAIVANLDDDDALENFEVEIRDLSTGGIKILSPNFIGRLTDHLSVFFRMDVAGVERRMTMRGVIRSCDEYMEGEELYYSYGVQFSQLDENKRLMLHAYVMKCMSSGNLVGL
jgi:c-di-GMP-binding flagellar brake protein YcgR